jgi:eukaryotic-like serine/threonine-protein kinase
MWSHRVMPNDSKAMATYLSASEFLVALEGSGVLPEDKSRELRLRFEAEVDAVDPSGIAHQLVDDGTLTAFQARRLLKGKRGLTIGRYILLDHLGQGARGRVFKARHNLMDRVVALKVVRLDESAGSRPADRFFREMKIVALLDHPNVVRAIDADEHDGWPYIVMEYLEGHDLERVYARRGPLPPDEVIEYMAQAARGLAHAHERGVIHRDVKPTNLFLLDNGVVKLLDLGLGELVGAAAETANIFDTDEGVVVGTTDFMSPEQVKNKRIDARTDLFSLGCTMYRLLTGTYAFPGETREDRLIKRIRGRHVPITDVRPGISDDLVRIIDRLLATRRDDRFVSAAEAADALEALISMPQRPDRGAGAPPREKRPDASVKPVYAEAEVPVDWSQIESALGLTGHRPRRTARLVDKEQPKPPSSRGLSAHRKGLEDEGLESGRAVHEKYRDELGQMKRVMAELRSMDSGDDTTAADQTWFERMGEKLGDFLAEPSAAQIVIAALVVLLILALALAYAVS